MRRRPGADARGAAQEPQAADRALRAALCRRAANGRHACGVSGAPLHRGNFTVLEGSLLPWLQGWWHGDLSSGRVLRLQCSWGSCICIGVLAGMHWEWDWDCSAARLLRALQLHGVIEPATSPPSKLLLACEQGCMMMMQSGLRMDGLRRMLGRFGLSGHHHLQPIQKLSGATAGLFHLASVGQRHHIGPTTRHNCVTVAVSLHQGPSCPADRDFRKEQHERVQLAK